MKAKRTASRPQTNYVATQAQYSCEIPRQAACATRCYLHNELTCKPHRSFRTWKAVHHFVSCASREGHKSHCTDGKENLQLLKAFLWSHQSPCGRVLSCISLLRLPATHSPCHGLLERLPFDMDLVMSQNAQDPSGGFHAGS
jgi:hypothetical protein